MEDIFSVSLVLTLAKSVEMPPVEMIPHRSVVGAILKVIMALLV